MLVFDDLHWADRPTLQLLRHLVRSPQPRRVLLLGTYREAELEPGHPLLELIADVRREGLLKRLELGGLAEPEVAELVAALGVPAAEPAFVHALHGETDGNPFFIEEVVRHLRESERELHADISLTEAGVPDGVREVTGAAPAAARPGVAPGAPGRRRDRARVRLRRARRRSRRSTTTR